MKRAIRIALLVFLITLFLANAVAWIASENRLLHHGPVYEYVSEAPLVVRWRYWSLLDGRYEYSRSIQEDIPTLPNPSRPNRLRGTPISNDRKSYFSIPGFDIHRDTEVATGFQKIHFVMELDCSLVAFLSGAFPGYLLFRSSRAFYFRRKAKMEGLCSKCHYDLRAHISGEAGDKCPECGTVISARELAKKAKGDPDR